MKTIEKVCKRFIAPLLAVSAISMAAHGASQDHGERTAESKADGATVTVFKAKKIYTMDPGRPEATAIAVLDGKVLSTGSLESMKPWLSQYQYEVDESFKDKIIMPGFIDPHTHFTVRSNIDCCYVLALWKRRTLYGLRQACYKTHRYKE